MIDHPILVALQNAGIKMGLRDTRSFLSWIGDPHLAYPVIHVAGTNGKGSVCRFVGAMLEAQGYRVGIHTSPHLQEVNERFRLGATPVDDARLDRLLQETDVARRAWAAEHCLPDEAWPLSYFEMTTVAAYKLFAEERVDAAVVEVGMGGRLDATNVCAPTVTAIISVGLDHTQQLGPDHAAIAAEKAGILKPGVPAVLGPMSHSALSVIRTVAVERGVPLHIYGSDFVARGDSDGFSWRSGTLELDGLRTALAGDHQMVNAAVALKLVSLLPQQLRVSEAAMREGLSRARNRGRMEWLAPDLLVDGAHNLDGAQVLAGYLKRLRRDRPRTLLLGAGYDKDVRAVAAVIAPNVDRVFTTTCAHPRARSPYEVARELEGLNVPVTPAGAIEDALEVARNGRDLVVVAGSLFLVGAVRNQLGLH